MSADIETKNSSKDKVILVFVYLMFLAEVISITLGLITGRTFVPKGGDTILLKTTPELYWLVTIFHIAFADMLLRILLIVNHHQKHTRSRLKNSNESHSKI